MNSQTPLGAGMGNNPNNDKSIVVGLFSSGGVGHLITGSLKDFDDASCDRIVAVIKKIFKKHRGPKEIIEDEKGDEDPPVKPKPKRIKYIADLDVAKRKFTKDLTDLIDEQMDFLKVKIFILANINLEIIWLGRIRPRHIIKIS